MVLDEAHHCDKNHAFNRIAMSHLYPIADGLAPTIAKPASKLPKVRMKFFNVSHQFSHQDDVLYIGRGTRGKNIGMVSFMWQIGQKSESL